MSLLWFEGFDWIATGTTGTAATNVLEDTHYMFASFGSGSRGIVDNTNIDRPGNGLRFGFGHSLRTNKLRETGPSTSNTFIMGFFLRTPASISNNSDLIFVFSQNIIQFTIESNSDGSLDLNRGFSTVIATSPVVFTTSNDYYVEFKVVVDDRTQNGQRISDKQ